jgi:hydroxyethylthiazole kinase
MAADKSVTIKSDIGSPLIDHATRLIERLRARSPRVHCITNTVAQPITANALLAAGAIPSLTTSEDEIGAFARSANGLLVNLGTLDAERRRAIDVALEVAREAKIPWLLDPVFVERSALRLDYARKLLARGPKAVRLNGAEFTALAGEKPSPAAVRAFAKSSGTIVALTSEADLVSDGERLAIVSNGDALMSKVTAMGCAGSAFATAALAIDADAFSAVTAALTVFGVAGELAAAVSNGPGTFAFAIIDALHAMTPDMVRQHARVADAWTR